MPPPPAQPDPKEAVEARLSAYLEGDLSDADRADLDRHLAGNPVHRQLLAELAEQRQWLRALPREPAPADVGDAYQQQVERSMLMGEGERPARRGGTGRWSQVALVAALVVATVGLGTVLVMILAKPASTRRVAVDLPARPPAEAAGRAATAPVVTATPPAAVPATPPVAVADAQRAAPPPPAAAAPSVAAGPPPDVIATQQAFAQQQQQAGLSQNVAQNAERPGNSLSAAAEEDAGPVHLTVATADPAGVDARIRRFVAAGRVSLVAAPPAAAQLDREAYPSGVAKSMRSLAPASRPGFAGGSGGGRERQAAAPPPAGPVQYRLSGLSPEQVRQLAADLSATVDPPAVPPIHPGQTVTVTVAQLAGRPGLSAANVVRVSADGTVAVPMIDPVPAAGATPAVVATRVADGYRRANLIPAATVTVTPAADAPAAGGAGFVDAAANRPAQAAGPGGVTVVIDVRPAGNR